MHRKNIPRTGKHIHFLTGWIFYVKCRLQEPLANGEGVVATGVIDMSTSGKRPKRISDFEKRKARQCGDAKILAHPVAAHGERLGFLGDEIWKQSGWNRGASDIEWRSVFRKACFTNFSRVVVSFHPRSLPGASVKFPLWLSEVAQPQLHQRPMLGKMEVRPEDEDRLIQGRQV